MENHRLLLYFTLFFIMYLLWAQWQMDYGPKPMAEVVSENADIPAKSADTATAIPEAADVAEASQTLARQQATKPVSQHIEIKTDVLKITLDTKGGDVIRAELLNYAVDADNPEEKVTLLTTSDINFHIAQSGLVSAKKDEAPTHNAVFSAAQHSYEMTDGQNHIEVALTWRNDTGVTVVKTYRFERDSYVIGVHYQITAGTDGWTGSQYHQLVRNTPDSSGQSAFIYTYTGGVIYNEEIKYEKIDFDDIAEQDLKMELKDGWLAMIQHYFLSAWIPEKGHTNLYYSRYNRSTDRYILGVRSPALKLQAGQQGSFSARLVVGPKLQNKLEEIEPGLELTVDYGVLTIIAKPLFWLLDFFHNLVGNWGWAIILLTITVKVLFYKLSEMSYRSMAKMRKVAPRIKQMKERFGDDRQAMSKAMMDMYKREKINPLGGCFPILVQIPVFISLYWVLLESVEMRQAPFILWITNLSDKDPYFVLPVIMGVSMYIQQKLNPAPVDPMQQKIFQIMPFAFTIMFAFFPSGLVLYWVVNNILSIAQQWYITRQIENA